jgi:AraC-like DNA-binding protein
MTAAMDPGSDPTSDLRQSVQTYERVLSGAGGRELEAHKQTENRPLLRAALYASPPYALNVPPLPVPRLAVNLTPAKVSGGIDNDRVRSFDARRHSLFLTPADAPASWSKESPSRHIGIYFNADLFDSGDEGASPIAQTSALLNVTVPGLGPLADQLAGELKGKTLLNAEAVDSLARLLLIHLARHLQGESVASRPLTPQALDRLREYIVEHLSGRILVADLARQVNLSANYFARSFAEQTGQSPHRFVLALRLDRAVQLLDRSKLSLVEIAHACGFASQQHLNNAMQRHLGTTPGRYRAGARGRSQAPTPGAGSELRVSLAEGRSALNGWLRRSRLT